jgi:hypothetical protein
VFVTPGIFAAGGRVQGEALSDRRRKTLTISCGLVADLFRDGESCRYRVTDDGLPADARVVDAKFDGFRDEVQLLIESDEFEPVPDGQPWPAICPMMRVVFDALAMSLN